MAVVIELTLHAAPGHLDEAFDTYAEFVNELEHDVDDLRLAVLAADSANNIVRGVGIYDRADVAESLTSLQLFADLVDHITPHLAGAPERTELQLLDVFVVDTPVPDEGIDTAVLIELSMRAKLGHVEELVAQYESFIAGFQTEVPDARVILHTADPASGLVRGIVVYDHAQVAEAVGSSPLLRGFLDSVQPLLAGAPERTEMRLLHLFARP